VSREGSLAYLRRRHPDIAAAFDDELRRRIVESSTLDGRTAELVMVAGYAVARHPRAFAIHCRRALAQGASPDDVRSAVMLVLGASTGLEPTVDALTWIDDVVTALDRPEP